MVLYANAFVQAGQYFWLYAAVPVLAWMVLASLALLPFALIGSQLGNAERGKAPLWFYAAVLAALGTLSIVTQSIGLITARMRDVGLIPSGGTVSTLWLLAITATAAAASVSGAAADWYAARVRHPLRAAARVALITGLLLLWPVVHFFATDWIWSGASSSTIATSARPNVLLISIDTLRADHLGSYGDVNQLTPQLDRFANEGVVFEQAMSSSPWTLPAMASLFTAQYPRRHHAGAITNRRDPLGRSALPPNSWTLVRTLHERGYRTRAVVTNPYLALRYGLGEGFDRYENLSIESEAFIAFQETTALRLLEWLWPDVQIGDRS